MPPAGQSWHCTPCLQVVCTRVICVKRLIYLAPVPLNSPSQRPHHFVEWAHERWGCEVWWVQPYPVRLPRLGDVRRLRRREVASGVGSGALGPPWRGAAWLHVVSLAAVPVEPLPGGRSFLKKLHASARSRLLALMAQEDTWMAVGRPSGLAMDLCTALQGQRVLYDVMDDMSQFSQGLSQRWMRRAHEAILAQAEAVWCSADKLLKTTLDSTRALPALVRNGTALPDPPRPGASGVGTAPHAQAPLVLGYVGTIASWFDWQALAQVASALPQARIEVYGPQESARPANLPPQVQLFAPVPHAEVFALMRQWHAGLIPFVRNALTASVDPVKYYEYRACGLPVLTTLFGEMHHHSSIDDGVWNMEDAQVLLTLEQRLRLWHKNMAERLARNAPLAPDCLRDASWAARFNAGIQAVAWADGSQENPA